MTGFFHHLLVIYDPRVIMFMEIMLLFILSRGVFLHISRILNRIVKVKTIYYWLFALIFLPGTLIHELGHYLSALALLVPVSKFELLPEYQDGKLKLGSVSFKKTDFIRAAIVAVFPFVFGVVILVVLSSYYDPIFNQSGYLRVVYYYFIFQIGNSMFLSGTDFKYVLYLLIPFGVVIFIAVFLNINLSDFFLHFMHKHLYDYSRIIALSLYPIIIIDIFIIVVLDILRR